MRTRPGCCPCEIDCDSFRNCFSQRTIVMTFVGLTPAVLNVSYEFTFRDLITLGLCLEQWNGEQYDNDYCVPNPCPGITAARPEWGFGVQPTTDLIGVIVNYDLLSFGQCPSVGNFGASMSFGYTGTLPGEQDGAREFLRRVCSGNVGELPFRNQQVNCCDGSNGKVLVERLA